MSYYQQECCAQQQNDIYTSDVVLVGTLGILQGQDRANIDANVNYGRNFVHYLNYGRNSFEILVGRSGDRVTIEAGASGSLDFTSLSKQMVPVSINCPSRNCTGELFIYSWDTQISVPPRPPRIDRVLDALGVRIADPTPYDILGVPPSATPAEIRAAYRRLALKWHPDKQMRKTPAEVALAAEVYQRVDEAYTVLGRP